MSNIVDKFKDMLDGDDDRKEKTPQPEDPPLETQCCGMPPGQPLVGSFEHKADCPKHPDNLAKEEVVG
ncbi:hypothetical protein JNUCC0626_41320 [Lentzea sp. JNUCC 0626]|uniref:hypothetical protein n=1 Tax=Lentzea sp. JNUCC 0626 TaxID=3367513 RepID=UPI0037497685